MNSQHLTVMTCWQPSMMCRLIAAICLSAKFLAGIYLKWWQNSKMFQVHFAGTLFGLLYLSSNVCFAEGVRTRNFLVTARDPRVAKQVAEYAEHYRRSKSLQWLGYEMPDWPEPCTVEVRLSLFGRDEAGGATSFEFDHGRVLSQRMVVSGSLERILSSVLPHEVTHTVFASKFRRPLPRWADEGGSVLSEEDYEEHKRHDLLVRQMINSGDMIPLRDLFVLTQYPRNVMALYAEGFSVANFLVTKGGRRRFLEFVADGQQLGWSVACARHYGFRDVKDLEERWIEWLIVGRGTGATPIQIPEDQQQAPVTLASRPSSPPATAGAFQDPYPRAAVGYSQSTRATSSGFDPAGNPVRGNSANPYNLAVTPNRSQPALLPSSPQPAATLVARGQSPDLPTTPPGVVPNQQAFAGSIHPNNVAPFNQAPARQPYPTPITGSSVGSAAVGAGRAQVPPSSNNGSGLVTTVTIPEPRDYRPTPIPLAVGRTRRSHGLRPIPPLEPIPDPTPIQP